MYKLLLLSKVIHRLETNLEMLKIKMGFKRSISVKGTKINYELPKYFSLSQLGIARYLGTKDKEEDTFFWLLSHKKSADAWNVFIDIGCNVGVFSLLARKLLNDIDIFSFDPILNNCLTTHQMLKENTKTDALSIVQQAFLSDEVNIQNSINPLASQGSTISNTKARNLNLTSRQGDCLSIPLRCFGLIGKQKIGQKKTICKIDVDGHELEIIKGFSDEQLSVIGSLCVEVDILEQENTIEIDRYLRSSGFIPSGSNLNSLDPYIKIANSEEKSSLMSLKRRLSDQNETKIDDGLISYLSEMDYHDLRAKRIFYTYYSLSKKMRQSHRIALNWYYYRKNMTTKPNPA